MLELREQGREVFRKHHPGLLQSDEQIIRQFVVRQPELEILLDLLRGNLDSPSCQHALILGPRGRGKSTLLTRIAAELRTNSEFAPRLLPVWFADGSAEVFDAASFWLDALFHLARELEPGEPEVALELRESRADLARRWRGGVLEERARAAVLEAAERMDRRLVLMVENLQGLFGSGNEDFGWKLRATLQSEPRIVLLGTATTRFAALNDARAPFFELFHMLDLEPLNAEGCGRLWEAVAGESLNGRDIRPIEILTGGNPRLLVIVGQFAERLSARSLMERLAALIDDHSEYFRSQLEALPTLERRVFLAMADLWQPSEAGEIAARARLDIRTVSVMLGRLRKRGAVIVRRAGKKQVHAVAERLFCIYYKLRREQNEAGVIHNLIRYMALFYGREERAERFSGTLAEAKTAPEIREGLARALAEQPDLTAVFGAGDHPLLSDIRRRAEEIGDRTAERQVLRIASALSRRDFEEAVDLVDQVTEMRGPLRSASLDSHVAMLLLIKSMAQESMGKTQELVGTLLEFVERFENTKKPSLQKHVGLALVAVAERQLQAGNARAAIGTCSRVLDLFGRSPVPALQVSVAAALNTSGAAYQELANPRSARAAYEELLNRFEAVDVPGLREEIAKALVNNGMLQAMAGDSEQGTASLNEVIERFQDAPSEDCVVSVGMALLWMSVDAESRGNVQEALDAAGRAIVRLEKIASHRVRPFLAVAMVRKGNLLIKERDLDAAIKVYEEAAANFRDVESGELAVHVSEALASQGLAHRLRNEPASALAKWDEVVARFGDSDAPRVQRQVTQARVWKAVRRLESGLPTEALAVCDEIESRRARVPDAERAPLIWNVQWVRSQAYIQMNTEEAAFAAFRAAYEVFVPGSDVMMLDIQKLVPDLVAAGVSPANLEQVLTSNPQKAASVSPLIAALRNQAGRPIRAPVEVLEVAKDVGELMKEPAAVQAE